MANDPSTTASTERPVAPPYAASWIDALVAWVGRLPGPAWAAYLVALVGFAVLNNVVFWLDGSLAPGTFAFTRSADAFFIVYFLALYHHLGSVGGRCLQAFEPLLDASPPERAATAWRLTRLPRRLGWVVVPIGLVVGVGSAAGRDAGMGLDAARTLLPFVYQGLALSFTVATMGALAVQVVRQLRTVGGLHRRAAGIDLFHLRPAHAFATLTARTGSGLVGFVIVNAMIWWVDGAGAPLSASVTLSVLAVLAFVLPLLGLRERLKAEKERALDRIDDGIKATLAQIQEQVEAGRHDEVGGLNTALNALLTSRKVVAGISTWPWETETLRSFASTLVVPIALWLITRLLGRLV
jgi:hypothetical protein